jgi:hypothetical protein
MRPLLVLVLALVPFAGAACGSDSDGAKTTGTGAGTTTTSPGSTVGYVGAGNQVCIRSDRRIFKIGRLTRDPKGWGRTAASARQAMTEMKQVRPPAARAAAFQQMLRYGNALALSIQEVHDSLVKKDYDTASAAQLAAGQIQDRVHSSAKSAGLTFCQQNLTNWPA